MSNATSAAVSSLKVYSQYGNKKTAANSEFDHLVYFNISNCITATAVIVMSYN